MDGPHDLGGKEGFGPVDVTAPPFRHDWERTQWALSQLVPVRDGITIDWWRHGIETMDPAVYLTVPYFVKWHANDVAHAIEGGLFTLEELVAGHPDEAAPPAPAQSVDELAEVARARARSFEVPTDRPPAFAPGDRVVTRARPTPGHTRLPAYARAATGTVLAHHGAHLYPDLGAKGIHEGRHLYTVEFAATDLWEDAAQGDTVCLDLWEPYLANA